MALLFGAAAAAAAASPSSVDLPLLFTDNALFESTHGGISLRVQPPAVGPVVIGADKPWENWASKASTKGKKRKHTHWAVSTGRQCWPLGSVDR